MGVDEHGTYNLPKLKSRRKEMRNHGTAAEAVLWKSLQKRKIAGKKFRRQCGIGPYIVDFFCPECRLIVELDGAPHSFQTKNYPKSRDRRSPGCRAFQREYTSSN